MSKKWQGGIVTPTPATPSGPYDTSSAPGIWTLSQQAYWGKQGLWPTAGNALPTARAYVVGGYTAAGGGQTLMQYVEITTTGISSSFGNLTSAQYYGGALSSFT